MAAVEAFYACVFVYAITSIVAAALLVVDAVKGPGQHGLITAALAFNNLAWLSAFAGSLLGFCERCLRNQQKPVSEEIAGLLVSTAAAIAATVMNAQQFDDNTDALSLAAGLVPLGLNVITATLALGYQVKALRQ